MGWADSTWIAKSWQRTFVNTRAKFLMLRHTFEVLGCNAVELRTHRLNNQSRAAIERLGARLDGILRQYVIMPDSHIHDTADYSIIRDVRPRRAASCFVDCSGGTPRSPNPEKCPGNGTKESTLPWPRWRLVSRRSRTLCDWSLRELAALWRCR